VPDVVLDYHRLKVPIDHPDLSIGPPKLDLTIAGRTFAWWVMASGYDVIHHHNPNSDHTYSLINSVLTDIAYVTISRDGMRMPVRHQYPTWNSLYTHELYTGATTADHDFVKWVTGTFTRLGYEAVDLSDYHYVFGLSVSGSTFKAYRAWENVKNLSGQTPKFTVTDTTYASGRYGLGFTRGGHQHYLPLTLYLSPVSQGIGALAILEVGVAGRGLPEDPFSPDLLREPARAEDGQPIDLLSLSIGSFEFSERSPTNIVMVFGDNPYRPGALQRQIDFAVSKGLRYLRPPKDYREAVLQYAQLSRDFKHWLAGKDSFAYQVLGTEELEPFAVADFYYGELVEHRTHYDQLKQVPDWEMAGILNMWLGRLMKATVLAEEREKHIEKLRAVLKGGW
jgi:hypothetical protein